MAQQEIAPNKPVHLIYLCGGIVLFYLLQWTIAWIWGSFVAVPNDTYMTALAGVLTIVFTGLLYRNEKAYKFCDDVANEMKKVTWPTGKEVRASTIVVVVVTMIAATILGFMDFGWGRITEWFYGA